MFRHYMMKHSSVNGLMDISTVQEVYDMIVEYARGFVDASSSAEAKTLQQRIKDRKNHLKWNVLVVGLRLIF